jgi:hypothetical protein
MRTYLKKKKKSQRAGGEGRGGERRGREGKGGRGREGGEGLGQTKACTKSFSSSQGSCWLTNDDG